MIAGASWKAHGCLISTQVRIYRGFRNFQIFDKNIQHFRKFWPDRTLLSSRLLGLLLANFESLVCRITENQKFTCVVSRQMYASARILHRNLWIGARPENRQCIASGKPSTRFPLGWHVQKGYVFSHIRRVWSRNSLCGWGLLYWFEHEYSELSGMLDGRPTSI